MNRTVKKDLPVWRCVIYMGAAILLLCGLASVLSSCGKDDLSNGDAPGSGGKVEVKFRLGSLSYGGNEELSRADAKEAIPVPVSVVVPLGGGLFMQATLEAGPALPATRAEIPLDDNARVVIAAYPDAGSPVTANYTVQTGGLVPEATGLSLDPGHYRFVAYSYNSTTSPETSGIDPSVDLLWGEYPASGTHEIKASGNDAVTITLKHLFSQVKVRATTDDGTIEELGTVSLSGGWLAALNPQTGGISAGNPATQEFAFTTYGSAAVTSSARTVYPASDPVITIASVTINDRAHTSLAARFTGVTLKPNHTYTMNISFRKLDYIAPLFARSNIVLLGDGTDRILTFAESAADHAGKSYTLGGTDHSIAIPANVQGVHFRWGGLVGIGGDGGNNTAFNGSLTAGNVIFTPTEYPAPTSGQWIFNNNGMAVPRQVPYLDDAAIPTDQGEGYDAFIVKYPDAGYDAASGYGDICRYISDKGWVDGRWRMPTQAELRRLYEEKTAGPGNPRSVALGFGAIAIGGSNPNYGLHPVPGGRFFGGGQTSANTDEAHISNPADATVFLPASGYYNALLGLFSDPGANGHHWSASPHAPAGSSPTPHAYNLYFNNSSVFAAYDLNRSNGFPIRCIKDINR